MTVELIMVLPILLLLLFAMVQFSMLLTARQQLLAASREGARTGARGGSPAEVGAAVKGALGQGSLGEARVHYRVLAGDPSQPVPGRERVEVTVEVPATRVVPDLIRWVVSFEDQDLVATTVMQRE
jgi:hypothetical protein